MDVNKQYNSSNYFSLKPNYGASFKFDANLNQITMGHNHMFKMAKGINALSMTADLTFSELTDDESDDAVSFLQSKYYYNEQDYVTSAEFRDHSIVPFYFQGGIASTYDSNLRFYCDKFSHSKTFYNSNEITASFQCAAPSILNSVEPDTGYNPRIFHGNLAFSSESPSDTPNSVSANFSIPAVGSSHSLSATIKKGQHIFETGSYRSVVPSAQATVSNGGTYTTTCLSRFGMGASNAIILRDSTRSSIFMDSTVAASVNEYPYRPIQDRPGISQKDSIDYRMFDHYPSYSWQIDHAPKYKQSNVLDVYKKYSLFGMNPNLANLSLDFSNRTDEEAHRILLFLESHLGHKKFAFHLPQNYGNPTLQSSNFTTPHRKTYSTFVCPSWTHQIVYKNNHTINATFIECVPY